MWTIVLSLADRLRRAFMVGSVMAVFPTVYAPLAAAAWKDAILAAATAAAAACCSSFSWLGRKEP